MHGIQPCRGKGVVTLSVKDLGDRVRVAVRDTGAGISEEVVSRVARNEMPGNKIGLLNVHHRVKLLSGHGLTITRHQPGTEIAFTLSKSGQRLSGSLTPLAETSA
ncbi:signal transduction histidine kinase, LytS [Plautia stali symbiont]|nr:signal transduction histidine kinase, LytS [Plautia stali symbiont]